MTPEQLMRIYLDECHLHVEMSREGKRIVHAALRADLSRERLKINEGKDFQSVESYN